MNGTIFELIGLKRAAPGPATARDTLRRAHKALVPLRAEAERQAAVTIKVLNLVSVAEAAERQADAVENQYRASVAENVVSWAEAGGAGTLGDQSLAIAAQEARATARRSRLIADAAQSALSEGSTAAEANARKALADAEADIARAAWGVLEEEFGPVLERAQALHEQLEKLQYELQSIDRLCLHNVPGKNSVADYRSLIGRVTTLPIFSSDDKYRGASPWISWHGRLRLDPEAKFCVESSATTGGGD